ncbi:MAG: STAS domain-containing protein [Planctomycetes bacterium]|nr:STAS domain-containing protein [Planctomycetota bacterium]
MAIAHSIREAAPATVVEFKGEIDLANSPEVRKLLRGLAKEKKKLLICDLSKVEYIDSSGIATLLDCLKEMRKYKGVLRLAGLPGTVHDVFRLAKLEGVFEIFADVAAALAAPPK